MSNIRSWASPLPSPALTVLGLSAVHLEALPKFESKGFGTAGPLVLGRVSPFGCGFSREVSHLGVEGREYPWESILLPLKVARICKQDLGNSIARLRRAT